MVFHGGGAGRSSAPADRTRPSLNKEKDDAAREKHHLMMARRNSLTTVVTNVWEKAKHARDAGEEETCDIRGTKRASVFDAKTHDAVKCIK
jgi:hypothetical protein